MFNRFIRNAANQSLSELSLFFYNAQKVFSAGIGKGWQETCKTHMEAKKSRTGSRVEKLEGIA
ncbi:hypothetical protein [Candidatus Protochlamydia naegleriophila]|uniref:hypothetical protein n=1 Tax=Candidatus Protochlamydia naegleriophila TaxID=389348 RepID=UPI00073E417F|nr:hypothetical protein [Candidatus Protochlamydia naegleriophila]